MKKQLRRDYFEEGVMTIVSGTIIRSVDKTFPGW